MRIRYLIPFFVGCALGTWSAIAQAPAKKTAPVAKPATGKQAPAKTSTSKSTSQSTVAKTAAKTSGKKPTAPGKTSSGKTTSTTANRNSKTARAKAPVKKATSFQPRQSAPTSDRLKEIQGALAAKGYLKSEPSGVWNAESIDAMKRYQADQKLDPSGKITAASLIGLGLGPSTAAPAVPPSPATPPSVPQTIPPPL